MNAQKTNDPLQALRAAEQNINAVTDTLQAVVSLVHMVGQKDAQIAQMDKVIGLAQAKISELELDKEALKCSLTDMQKMMKDAGVNPMITPNQPEGS